MTTTDLDEAARQAVLLQLALAHDHFVSTERQAWKHDRKAEAAGARRVSTYLLRAYAAERDDPPWVGQRDTRGAA